jgi:hypothetical protein
MAGKKSASSSFASSSSFLSGPSFVWMRHRPESTDGHKGKRFQLVEKGLGPLCVKFPAIFLLPLVKSLVTS